MELGFGGRLRPSIFASLITCLAALLFAEPAAATKRSFCYKVSTVSPGTSTHFDREQTRCDVIWTDASVTIDEPLLTNGGDVVIFADAVRINAPIDTRPYFSTSQIFHPPVQGNELALVNWSSSIARMGIPAHKALFYWRERYDPKLKVWTYAVADGHYDGWADDRLAAPYAVAQFPSARPPKICQGNDFSPRGCDGIDAPSPAPEARRSGSVLIVTHKLSFCDECAQPLADKPMPPDTADTGDTERRRFIVTAGVKGGLGSPGTQIICGYGGCFNRDKPNESGRHGDGGDAGDVAIVTYGAQASADQDLWTRLTETGGGLPPFSGRLHTRSFLALNAHPDRGPGAFQRLAPVTPAPVAGAGSSPTFSTGVSGEEAIATVQTRIATIALTRRFASETLIRDVVGSASGFEEVVLPTDVLPRQMLDFRRAIYDRILANLTVEMADRPGDGGPLPFAPLVGALRCDKATQVLVHGALSREIEALCRIKPAYSAPRSDLAFLEATGGIFSPPLRDFDPRRYDSTALAQRLQNLNNVLGRIAVSNQQILGNIEEQVVKEDMALLRTRVAAAQKHLEDLQTLSNRPDNPLGAFAPLIRTFASQLLPVLGNVVGDMIAAEQAQPGSGRIALNDEAASRANRALQALVKGGLPLAQQLFAGGSDGPSPGEFFEARRTLLDAMYEVATLQYHAEIRRQDRLAGLDSTVRELLDARSVLTQDYASSVGAFEPLIKHAIAGALIQPADARAFLATRSEEVDAYLQNLGRVSLPLGFSVQTEGCGTAESDLVKLSTAKVYKSPDCARLRNDATKVWLVEVESMAFGKLPIAVLEPGSMTTISLRGMQIKRDGTKALLTVRERLAGG